MSFPKLVILKLWKIQGYKCIVSPDSIPDFPVMVKCCSKSYPVLFILLFSGRNILKGLLKISHTVGIFDNVPPMTEPLVIFRKKKTSEISSVFYPFRTLPQGQTSQGLLRVETFENHNTIFCLIFHKFPYYIRSMWNKNLRILAIGNLTMMLRE